MLPPTIAIVDYGVGNLFSVAQACTAVGLSSVVTDDADEIRRSQCVILPGIGAFGDAMAALSSLHLVDCLRRLPADGTPLVGICLGMQVLMERSAEFGSFEGLGLVAGTVERIAPSRPGVKVPQVGWNRVHIAAGSSLTGGWAAGLLGGIADGEPMYFGHSYVAVPTREDDVLARSTYGAVEFCSAVSTGLVGGFQFHPERSGCAGLQIYRNLATLLNEPRR
jgi:glutamine amidotransferase